MAVCKMCGEDRKLIKAHIIPETFFTALDHPQRKQLKKFSGAKGVHPVRSQTGEYDVNLVCEDCEHKAFSACDNYAARVLLQRIDRHFEPIVKEGETIGFRMVDIDQALLQRFFAAVLWRASLSEREFYRQVTIGAAEPAIRSYLANRGAASPRTLECLLKLWTFSEADKYWTFGIASPTANNIGDREGFTFYFGRVVAFIKIDERPFSEKFDGAMLARQKNTLVHAENVARSEYVGNISRIFNQGGSTVPSKPA